MDENPAPGTNFTSASANDPLAGLARWTSEGAVDRAAAERSRESWLRLQSSESAGITDVLGNHAEARRRVAASTLGGRRTSGMVCAIGVDFVIIREDNLGDVVIPTHRLAIIRAAPGDDDSGPDRPLRFDLTMAHALAELAVDRPPVLAAAGNEAARGTLQSVAVDFITVSTNDPRRTSIHVAMAAIDHLVVLTG